MTWMLNDELLKQRHCFSVTLGFIRIDFRHAIGEFLFQCAGAFLILAHHDRKHAALVLVACGIELIELRFNVFERVAIFGGQRHPHNRGDGRRRTWHAEAWASGWYRCRSRPSTTIGDRHTRRPGGTSRCRRGTRLRHYWRGQQ